MADTLEVFGVEYTGVTGIKATDDNGQIKTYIRPQGTKSISANGSGIDVTEYASVNVNVPSETPSLQTKTKTYTPTTSQQTETITADSGYDGLEEVDITVNAIQTETKSATPSETAQTITPSSGKYLSSVSVGAISSTYVGSGITRRSSSDLTASGATVTVPSGYYASHASKAVSSGTATAPSSISGTSATVSTGTNTLTLSKTVSVTPNVSTAGYISSGTAGNSSVSLTASVTTKGTATITPGTSNQTINSGTYITGTQTISGDANLVAGNIKSGTTIFGVTGTYAGGTSKNVQVLQSTSRTNSSSLTKVLGDLTVSKTGTYDVYWSGGRTNTSASYTWGTRLYVDGTGYGTENTSWSNNCQSNHLSNVSLTANQKLSVYSRGRSGSYYTFVPMLTIIEA